jgi:hypothetical protein
MPTKLKTTPTSDRGLIYGYKSGLEERIAGELRSQGVKSDYESIKIGYIKPAA